MAEYTNLNSDDAYNRRRDERDKVVGNDGIVDDQKVKAAEKVINDEDELAGKEDDLEKKRVGGAEEEVKGAES